MAKLITQCPSCQTGILRVAKIECQSCGTKFEGDFEIPALLKLPEDDLIFIQDFVRFSGSLKEMATKLKVSYPTVRNRLNSVIAELERLSKAASNEREKILTALEKGKITAKEAALRLKAL